MALLVRLGVGVALVAVGLALGLVISPRLLAPSPAREDGPDPRARPSVVNTGSLHTGMAAVGEFQRRLRAAGHVVFRSNDGKALRTDDDFELFFDREQARVDLLYFGISLEHFRGSYVCATDGAVSLALSGTEDLQLPELALRLHDGALLLLPTSETGDDLSNHFRALSGDDEKQSLAYFKEVSGTR